MELWNGATLMRSVATVCAFYLCSYINSLRHFLTHTHILLSSLIGKMDFYKIKLLCSLVMHPCNVRWDQIHATYNIKSL